MTALPALTGSAQAALPNLKGAFTASITPTSNGSANGLVSDTINPTVTYTTALTATGSGTCLLTTGEVTITGASVGSGNPATTHTPGSCNLYNATVEYTLTWAALAGTAGQLQVTCVWAVGIQVCSPGVVHGQLPLGAAA